MANTLSRECHPHNWIHTSMILRAKSDGNPTKFFMMEIHLGNEASIVIKSFHQKKFMAVATIGVGFDTFGDGLGLAGAFGVGIMVSRDGIKVFEEHETDDFGQEWQVRDTDPMIFQTARAPQFPTQCIMPTSKVDEDTMLLDEDGDEIPGAVAANGGSSTAASARLRRKKRRNRRRRRLGQMVSEEEAEAGCAHWMQEEIHFCVTDVMVTGDLELAEPGRYY